MNASDIQREIERFEKSQDKFLNGGDEQTRRILNELVRAVWEVARQAALSREARGDLG